jgi:thiol-disulfide isomerase/thioredoxin
VATGEKSSENKAQDTATNSEGYFTIQGLIPGQGYQLTARTREGDVKMSGVTMATAPNPRVLIVISEDFGSPPPAAKKNNDKSANANETSRDDAPVRPGAPTATGSTAELSPPAGEAGSGGDVKAVASHDRSDRERIQLSMGAGGRGPPAVKGYGGGRQVSARVPSCSFLTASQLDNFALYDLTGLPWEFKNHKGRLVLIDFWGTWCTYCIKGIPHLKTLHESYSEYGLEIVGIAYEQPAPAGDQARLVQEKRDQLKIPYRLLLGSNLYTCPVKTQFKVSAFPTMFLLDENNRIIWSKDHALSTAERKELEQIIRQELK